MSQKIYTITTELWKIAVNCYLVQTEAGFYLVDSGMPKKQASLVQALEAAGCQPGNLKLILLTHGDSDHAGNAAFLRQRYGAPVVMHADDAVNVETGDMFANKNVGLVAKTLAKMMFFVTGIGDFTPFTADLLLQDGEDLSDQGWEATVLHLPGHSKGSLCFLTRAGDLFCGDLLVNTQRPAVNTLGDDPAQLQASVQKLQGLGVKTVYPGHGRPFQLTELSI